MFWYLVSFFIWFHLFLYKESKSPSDDRYKKKCHRLFHGHQWKRVPPPKKKRSSPYTSPSAFHKNMKVHASFPQPWNKTCQTTYNCWLLLMKPNGSVISIMRYSRLPLDQKYTRSLVIIQEPTGRSTLIGGTVLLLALYY